MSDVTQSAQAQIGASSRLPGIAVALHGEHDAVWHWVRRELGILGRAVDNKLPDGLPEHGDLIVLRAVNVAEVMTNWVLRETPDSWFETATSVPIEETPIPVDDPR